MSRVKRGTTSLKHRKNILKLAKGYRFGRSRKEKQAKEAIYHAGNHAFAHRKKKKGDFRRLWTIRINAAIRTFGLSYSRLIDALNKNNVKINRKMLSEIAAHHPEAFKAVVEAAGVNVPATAAPVAEKKEAEVKEKPAKKATKSESDDLTKIEGIGPVIAKTLNEAGITTFEQLANSKDEDTQEIIKDVKGNHQAGTWNEQATLAKAGKWDELKELQDKLNGGVEK